MVITDEFMTQFFVVLISFLAVATYKVQFFFLLGVKKRQCNVPSVYICSDGS